MSACVCVTILARLTLCSRADITRLYWRQQQEYSRQWDHQIDGQQMRNPSFSSLLKKPNWWFNELRTTLRSLRNSQFLHDPSYTWKKMLERGRSLISDNNLQNNTHKYLFNSIIPKHINPKIWKQASYLSQWQKKFFLLLTLYYFFCIFYILKTVLWQTLEGTNPRETNPRDTNPREDKG